MIGGKRNLTKESPQRLAWLDLSKGIGVLIVIIVHSIIPVVNPVTQHLSSFAIALFFIMAGLTYNGDKHRHNLRAFAVSRFRHFMIPYFALYIIMMVLFLPLSANVGTFLTPYDVLFWFLYGAGPPDQATHLWFLPVLYFGLIIYALLELATHNLRREIRWLFIILLPVIAIAIRDYTVSIGMPLVPWRISSVLLASTFCVIGNEIRRLWGFRVWTFNSLSKNLIVFLLLSVLLLLTSEINGFVDIAIDSYGINAWLYMVTGTLGSVLVFMLASALERVPHVKPALLPVGENSQVNYEIHPVFFFLVPLSLYIAGYSPEVIDANFHYFWFVRLLLGLCLSLPFALLLVPRNKVLSIIFMGRYEEKK